MSLWTPPGAELGEFALPEPDPRMVKLRGGVDEHCQSCPLTYGRLKACAESWIITSTTPEGPATLLRTARGMFALGFYLYEQVSVACVQSIFAVEVALKQRLERGGSFNDLINIALDEGLVSAHVADIVKTGRVLRNRFVHEGRQPVWTFGMADEIIGASYRLVGELYPENEWSGSGSS
ncbi:hypothetical protein [Saccharopolyspora phatthalungensis]|uniref:DUF4145 domain-containing protein n=1 Tax=Saccharopolyspora phatthalungensis TaxID=664693 RepID=A0A840QFY8_9PSEU|nr:hypothetical protein [Saccharopolyspora phatthalungensis]MBB5157405.1 hypothetical protein [Saccharopolyspora phatthalungensis]